MCEKFKWSVVFLLLLVNLMPGMTQNQFFAPNQFYEPVSAPTEKSIINPTNSNYMAADSTSGAGSNSVNQPNYASAQSIEPVHIETQSTARVNSHLPDGTLKQDGQKIKEVVLAEDLSDPLFIRKNEVRESEKVGGDGINNSYYSKSTSSTFKEEPRYPNNDPTSNQQIQTFPNYLPHEEVRRNPNFGIPPTHWRQTYRNPANGHYNQNEHFPINQQMNMISHSNMGRPYSFMTQPYDPLNPVPKLNIPPHVQHMMEQHRQAAQHARQMHEQNSVHGNIGNYRWPTNGIDDGDIDNMNPLGHQMMLNHMASGPQGAMHSGGYQSFSTMGDDGQMHTRVMTW